MSQGFHPRGGSGRPRHPTPYADFFDGLSPSVLDVNRASRGLAQLLRRRAESADIDLRVDEQGFDPEFLPRLFDEAIAAAQAMKEAAELYSRRRGAVDQW